MTETQLLILANVILVGLVPLEWLYYRWQDRRQQRHEGGGSSARPSDAQRDESSEGDTDETTTQRLPHPVETVETH